MNEYESGLMDSLKELRIQMEPMRIQINQLQEMNSF